MRKLYKTFRRGVILLPAFLFACALILPWIPGATGLFSDSAGPWYQPVTAPLFLAALLYSFPVTFLCTRFVSDNMFFSPGYYLVLAVYTAAWMFLLRSIFRFFEWRAKKAI
jgi:phosphoglycerol transferase MdoB-like AlkP superfamily enzyme